MKTAEFLKHHRTKQNMSQWHLAEALGWDSGQYISNIERELCPFPRKSFKDVCKILKCSLNELIEAEIESVRDRIKKEIKKT